MPGSCPGGSREFEGGDSVGILGNNLFNYRQGGIGRLAEKKRLNNLVHMEYQSPPTQAAGIFPFSHRRGGTEAPPVQS